MKTRLRMRKLQRDTRFIGERWETKCHRFKNHTEQLPKRRLFGRLRVICPQVLRPRRRLRFENSCTLRTELRQTNWSEVPTSLSIVTPTAPHRLVTRNEKVLHTVAELSGAMDACSQSGPTPSRGCLEQSATLNLTLHETLRRVPDRIPR